MTKEDFIETIKGFEELPFLIATKDMKFPDLTFVKVLSDSVMVKSNGKPVIFKFEDISVMSFDNENGPLTSDMDDFWENECNTAKKAVFYSKLSSEDRRDEIKSGVKDTPIAKGWARVDAMLNDSKKNHSIKNKADKIIAECRSIIKNYDYREMRIFMGLVYAEAGEFGNAAAEFAKGGDLYNAACCAQINNDEKAVIEYLLGYASASHEYKADSLSVLFFLLSKYGDARGAVRLANNVDTSLMDNACADMLYFGMLLVYSGYDSAFSKYGFTRNNRLTAVREIASGLFRFIDGAQAYEANNKEVLPSARDMEDSTNDDNGTREKLYRGQLSNYINIDNNGYGWIKMPGVESQIYCNIRQIEDETLRNMLYREKIRSAKVSFTIGIGKNGQRAADHVKSTEELISKEQLSEGLLTEFGNYDKAGKIYGLVSSQNKQYLLREEAVIDPVLSLYLNDVFSSINETFVRFTWKKSGQIWIIKKIWLNREEEPELFEKYRPRVSEEKYDKFLTEIGNILALENEAAYNCPFGYEALEPWKESRSVESPRHQDDDHNDISHKGINELISVGTYYLTREKNLQKAEKYFSEVLKRNPEKNHINTAVSNLLMIYKQDKRNQRIAEAFELLEKYRTALGTEKYNNQMMDLLDRTENFERMISILTEIIPTAGKSKSHRVKQLIRCYIKLKKLSEARIALNKYKNIIDDLSYNNYYVSILEMSGEFENTVSYLKDIISKTSKVEHKLTYMNKLAFLYQKTNDYLLAIDIYEQWKKFYQSNRTNISSAAALDFVSNMETSVDRNLSILCYVIGAKDKAKSIAAELLRKNSNDTVANQILSDTYSIADNQTYTMLETEDGYLDYENTGIRSRYVDWILKNVDYKRAFAGTDILRNIENNIYKGDADQARTDIESLSSKYSGRSIADRSSIVLLAIAKIIQQFIETGKNNDYLSNTRLNSYIGRSLLFRAEAYLNETDPDRNCLRFYYFLSMRYLSRSRADTGSLFVAVNMLYSSFFLSDNELASVDTNSINDGLHVTPSDSFNNSLFSLKDLITCTFEIEKQYNKSQISEYQVARKMIEGIFGNVAMRDNFTSAISEILGQELDTPDTSEKFRGIWSKARKRYENVYNELRETVHSLEVRLGNQEALKKSIITLERISGYHIMCKTDNKYIDAMTTVIREFVSLINIYVVDDREDKLNRIIELCRFLENSIRETPTNFSYEILLEPLIRLNAEAARLKCALYEESKPVLEIYPESTVFYRDDMTNTTRLTIYVENKGNVQKADISDIILTLKNRNMYIIGNPEHIFSTVQGEGKEEYTVKLSFTDAEKKSQLFEIEFSFIYGYYNGSGEQVKQKYSENFQINLRSMDSFRKIEDKFELIASGGPVNIANDEMFYGRKYEMEGIINKLDCGDGRVLSHRGIYMYGQKRAGKSSIMERLPEKIQRRLPAYIVVNIGSIGEKDSGTGYEEWIKERLCKKLRTAIKKESPEIYDEIRKMNEFSDIMEVIKEELPGRTVMMLADEFTYIYESIKKKECSDSFPHFWKALLQNYDLSFIIIGQDSMVNFVEEYPNDFACMDPMFVGYLDEEDARRFIDEPVRDNGETRYDPAALDMIYELTAGSAYLIAILCHQLVMFMNIRGTSRITKTTLEIFINSWLFNTAKNSKALRSDIFDPQFNDPSFVENAKETAEDNRTILSYIANNCNLNKQIKISEINCKDALSVRTDEYQRMLIEQLIKRKVLISEREFCRIWVDLLRIYLKKEGK